jgi:hypothetical protein
MGANLMNIKNWEGDKRPKRFGWAPGSYMNNCQCGETFIGDKRAIMCADCAYALPDRDPSVPRQVEVTDEMLTAAMRAFEPMSSVLRYREKDKWHFCDMMGMRDAIRAALALYKSP